MKSEIYGFLMLIGKAGGCHQLPERSFHINGHQFPVCARCTGAFTGYFLGLMTYNFLPCPTFVLFIFCAVMLFDWLIQYLEIMPSTNIRRFITGTLCGFALMRFYLIALKLILMLLKSLILLFL